LASPITKVDTVGVPSRDTERSGRFKGVEFVGETVGTGVCHMATFTDPHGNQLVLHRRYAPYADSFS
jgi:hypothetical protein